MLSLSQDTWGPEELAAIDRIAKGGHYTIGRETQAFEEAYAAYCGSKFCVAVNSGSSANLLMVAAWTLRYGKGTVVVPAVGWATSYSPFQQYGWKLRFVDIDRHTLNYDLKHLQIASDHADVILAINLLGNPNDFAAFPNLPILEDNCEAMGAVYNGKKTGTFGVMSSHSTYFSHHICTIEGGMITTEDEYFYHMLLSLRSHGWTRHLPFYNCLGAKPEKFSFILPGYNVRPNEMQCAIGLEQLKKLPGFIEMRRENASRFPYRTQQEIGESSWFGFAVFGGDVAKVEGKYETRPVVTGNFLRQPVIDFYNHHALGPMKNANYIHDHACMVGNSHKRIDWA
jgi:CDP-4-dehydro-6-deoxyglucose reductase, E1